MSLANPINAPAGELKPECWKRKGSEEEDEERLSNVKRARYSWHVILESESPQPTSSDEDDESVHSIQGVETEFAHDTEDTSTNSWVTSSDNVEVSIHEEYDPVSPSEDENPFIDDSSSDPEELLRVGVIAIAHAACDSDVGLADDSDDSRTSRDSEISLADYWTCFQCNTSNNNPKFRYCDKCYTERKNHLPLRPKGKKRRGKLSTLETKQSQSLEGNELTAFDSGLGSNHGSQRSLTIDFKRIDIETISESQLLKEHEITAFDSGLGSSQETQPSVNLDYKKFEIDNNSDLNLNASQTSVPCSQQSIDTVDMGFTSSQPSTSHQSQPSSQETIESTNLDIRRSKKTIEETELRPASQESAQSLASTVSVGSRDLMNWESSDESRSIGKIIGSRKTVQYQIKVSNPENSMCISCTVGPKNGIFVHGRSSHICCCYRCAKRVWKTSKHCPICNRQIRNVIKAYYA